MIFEVILSILIGVVKFWFYIFPSLPDMPEAIVSGGSFVIDLLTSVGGFLQVLYGAPLLSAIVVVLLASLALNQVYWLALWLIEKVPFINIK